MNALLRHCASLAAGAFLAVSAHAVPTVEMQTSMGRIVIELDSEKAPKTVQNFVQYVNEGFYNGTVFHRVIDGFMIQGGGYTTELVPKGGLRPPVMNEADNGLSNMRGTLAMARTGVLDSATSQFFINTVDNIQLDTLGGGYAVFGKVVSGLSVVDQINLLPTSSDIPLTPVVINSMTQTQ